MTVVTASNLTRRWPQIAPPNIYNFKFSWGENPPPSQTPLHMERRRRSGSPAIAQIWVHIDRRLPTPLQGRKDVAAGFNSTYMYIGQQKLQQTA